jgi:hypothetical protein
MLVRHRHAGWSVFPETATPAAGVAPGQKACPPVPSRRWSGGRSPSLRPAERPAEVPALDNKRETGTRQACSRIPGAARRRARGRCRSDDGVVPRCGEPVEGPYIHPVKAPSSRMLVEMSHSDGRRISLQSSKPIESRHQPRGRIASGWGRSLGLGRLAVHDGN